MIILVYVTHLCNTQGYKISFALEFICLAHFVCLKSAFYKNYKT